MTEYLKFDEVALRTRLSLLPANSATAFAFLCATRLVRTVKESRSVPDSTRTVLMEAETALREFLAAGNQVPNLLDERLLDASPDEEEDPSFEGAALEDACAALVYALRTISSDPAENAAFAARRVYESADRYASRAINEGEYSEITESLIMNSDVVQCELKRQYRDYAAIVDGANVIDLTSITGGERVFDPFN
ncbi:hypothetical protein ACVWZA_002534 [Sphingomonas sp. UYAg733]